MHKASGQRNTNKNPISCGRQNQNPVRDSLAFNVFRPIFPPSALLQKN